jgi:hypothetical protein
MRPDERERISPGMQPPPVAFYAILAAMVPAYPLVAERVFYARLVPLRT